MDAFASEFQYADHLRNVWLALDPSERGTFYTARRNLERVRALGIDAVGERPSRKGGLILVAAFSDLQAIKPRPAVLLEHGAGQTYRDVDHPSYSGGPERENVVLFLCPNEEVAARNRARYPEAAAVAVGCPKLDPWHCNIGGRDSTADVVLRERSSTEQAQTADFATSDEGQKSAVLPPASTLQRTGDGGPMHRERPSPTCEPEPRSANPGPVVAGPQQRYMLAHASGQYEIAHKRAPEIRADKIGREVTVAISFHWDARSVCPEARWAFPHFKDALPALAERFTVLGHGHPRVFDHLKSYYLEVGIEPVRDFAEVLERADCYAIDNSSTGVEWMATDRPLVWLNAPWYRRDVWHGGRFWDWARAGVQCGEPSDLVDAVERSLEDPLEMRLARRDVCSRVYVHLDGRASERAASAIRKVMECQATPTVPAAR